MNVPQRDNKPQGTNKGKECGADSWARQYEEETSISSKGPNGQQTYGAQKRSGSDYPESYSKKSKVSLVPALGKCFSPDVQCQ